MAIDITGANTYFGATVHIRSEAWTQVPQARRIAAIAHATRLIESRLEDALEMDTTVAGDFPRHDAAIYEQALWMIENADLDSKIKDILINSKNVNLRALTPSPISIALPALRFLVLNPRSVRLSRG